MCIIFFSRISRLFTKKRLKSDVASIVFFHITDGRNRRLCFFAPSRRVFVSGNKNQKFFSGFLGAHRKKGGPLRIYIEGDGFAWINPYTPSADPTPSETTALNLAQKDPFANVIYLAGRVSMFLRANVVRIIGQTAVLIRK